MLKGKKKSVLDFSVQDASAALPQNCQTTKWILKSSCRGVNVTLVTVAAELYGSANLFRGLPQAFNTLEDGIAQESRSGVETPGYVAPPALISRGVTSDLNFCPGPASM